MIEAMMIGMSHPSHLCHGCRFFWGTKMPTCTHLQPQPVTFPMHDLHAVFYTQDNQVFWYHTSFPDFIFDQAHSNFCISEKDFAFLCNEAAHHIFLGKSCFHIIEMELSGLLF